MVDPKVKYLKELEHQVVAREYLLVPFFAIKCWEDKVVIISLDNYHDWAVDVRHRDLEDYNYFGGFINTSWSFINYDRSFPKIWLGGFADQIKLHLIIKRKLSIEKEFGECQIPCFNDLCGQYWFDSSKSLFGLFATHSLRLELLEFHNIWHKVVCCPYVGSHP